MFVFFFTLPSQSLEETFNLSRPFTVTQSSYRPNTLEESLYYMELYEFLSKNKHALSLLESARKGGVHYNSAQSEFNRYLSNPVSNLREGFDLINRNTHLKAKAQIGAKISNADIGLSAEVDLKRLGNDILNSLSSKEYNQKVTDTAQFYTREIYACLENNNQCSINAQVHQIQALKAIRFHFHDFPQDKDQEGNRLNFEEKSQYASPAQIEMATTLFNTHQLRSISTQNEQNTEEIINAVNTNTESAQQISQKEKEEIITAINKHTKNIQESALIEMERLEHLRRENMRQNDPDYMNRDPIVLATNNSIQSWEKEKEQIASELEQGSITQEEYSKEIENIDRTIKEKQIDIQVYEFKKHIQNGIAWANAVEATGRVLGAPEEIIQLSRAGSASMQTIGAIGSMFIAGSIDPTGLTLALNGVSMLITAISNNPNSEQIMIELLDGLRKRQIQILNKLNEIDFKVEEIQLKVNHIIEILQMNHNQITEKLDRITDDLQRIESEMILAITEAKSTTMKESQKRGAFFTDDGRVVLDVLENWERPHLNEVISQCKHYKDQYDKTGNIRFYDDYNWCIDKARNQLFMIQESLSDMYQKSRHRFGSDTYIVEQSINKLSIEQVIDEWNKLVEDRIGIFSSIHPWLNQQYSKYMASDRRFGGLWAESQPQWDEYRQFLNRIREVNIKHPLFYDEVLSVYAPLTEKLPLPKNLSFITESNITDYKDAHLTEMCQNLKHIEDLSQYNRDHLQRAWLVYLYLSDQLKRQLNNLMEKHIDQLIERHEEQSNSFVNTPALKEPDCNCSSNYAQTEAKFFQYISSQKQTDIFRYIQNQGYNIHDFMNINPEETARKASRRPHITNPYLLQEGFFKTVQTGCGMTSKGQRKDVADLNQPKQAELFEKTLEEVRRGSQGGCWFIDQYGLFGQTGQKIQLSQQTGPYEFEGRALETMCPIFVVKKTEGTMKDEVQKRAICLETKIHKLETISTLDNLVFENLYDWPESLPIGKDLKFIEESRNKIFHNEKQIDINEPAIYVFFRQKTMKENPVYHTKHSSSFINYNSANNTTPKEGGLFTLSHYKIAYGYSRQQSEIVDSPHYRTPDSPEYIGNMTLQNRNGNTISFGKYNGIIEDNTYQQVETATQNNYPIRIDTQWIRGNFDKQNYWTIKDNLDYENTDSHGICLKKACLEYEEIKEADREAWIQTAAQHIRQLQGFLNTDIKRWINKANLENDDNTPKLHMLLPKSALVLDTMARAGYGQSLETQPDLLNIVEEIKSLKEKINTQNTEQILKIIQSLRDLNANQGIPSLPIQPIVQEVPVGLGDTKSRHQALNIILNRNYLSPRECRYLKRREQQ